VPLFVATILAGGGNKSARGYRTVVADALNRIFTKDLAWIIAGQGGDSLSDITPADIDVRTARYQIGTGAPALTIDLRPHEEATFMQILPPANADSITYAFVLYAATALQTLGKDCTAAELEYVRIGTWLPGACGVDFGIFTGCFVKTWGGQFRAGDGIRPVSPA